MVNNKWALTNGHSSSTGNIGHKTHYEDKQDKKQQKIERRATRGLRKTKSLGSDPWCWNVNLSWLLYILWRDYKYMYLLEGIRGKTQNTMSSDRNVSKSNQKKMLSNVEIMRYDSIWLTHKLLIKTDLVHTRNFWNNQHQVHSK